MPSSSLPSLPTDHIHGTTERSQALLVRTDLETDPDPATCFVSWPCYLTSQLFFFLFLFRKTRTLLFHYYKDWKSVAKIPNILNRYSLCLRSLPPTSFPYQSAVTRAYTPDVPVVCTFCLLGLINGVFTGSWTRGLWEGSIHSTVWSTLALPLEMMKSLYMLCFSNHVANM